MFVLPDRQFTHWPHWGEKSVTTWSPGATDVTPSPTASTTPAPSWPSTHGEYPDGSTPDAEYMSVWHTPQACSGRAPRRPSVQRARRPARRAARRSVRAPQHGSSPRPTSCVLTTNRRARNPSGRSDAWPGRDLLEVFERSALDLRTHRSLDVLARIARAQKRASALRSSIRNIHVEPEPPVVAQIVLEQRRRPVEQRDAVEAKELSPSAVRGSGNMCSGTFFPARTFRAVGRSDTARLSASTGTTATTSPSFSPSETWHVGVITMLNTPKCAATTISAEGAFSG